MFILFLILEYWFILGKVARCTDLNRTVRKFWVVFFTKSVQYGFLCVKISTDLYGFSNTYHKAVRIFNNLISVFELTLCVHVCLCLLVNFIKILFIWFGCTIVGICKIWIWVIIGCVWIIIACVLWIICCSVGGGCCCCCSLWWYCCCFITFFSRSP